MTPSSSQAQWLGDEVFCFAMDATNSNDFSDLTYRQIHLLSWLLSDGGRKNMSPAWLEPLFHFSS